MNDIFSGIPSEGESFVPMIKQTETAPESQSESNKVENSNKVSDKKEIEKEESPSHQGEKKVEDKTETNTDDENKNVPFHKHPRWIKLNSENKSLKNDLGELRSTLETITSELKTIKDEKVMTTLPKWFIDKYGYDYDTWQNIMSEVKKEPVKTENTKSPKDLQSEADKYIETNLKEIESDNELDFESEDGESLKNEFLDFLAKNYNKAEAKYKVEDKNGNIDFQKGWEIFNDVREKKENTSLVARKKLASDTSSNGKSEEKPRKVVTSEDLRKMRARGGWGE